MSASAQPFLFIHPYNPRLFELATQAEAYLENDPNACILKLRQFGEILAQMVAIESGAFESFDEMQVKLLQRLKREKLLPPSILKKLHTIRHNGNRAAHEYLSCQLVAMQTLELTYDVAFWFHATFEDKKEPDPKTIPQPPEKYPNACNLYKGLPLKWPQCLYQTWIFYLSRCRKAYSPARFRRMVLE
jgi:type I restriction enzyme, R subunit